MIFRLPDLARVGIPYSDVHLHRLEAAGKFPKRFKLLKGCTSQQGRVGWLESEIMEWIKSSASARGGSNAA